MAMLILRDELCIFTPAKPAEAGSYFSQPQQVLNDTTANYNTANISKIFKQSLVNNPNTSRQFWVQRHLFLRDSNIACYGMLNQDQRKQVQIWRRREAKIWVQRYLFLRGSNIAYYGTLNQEQRKQAQIWRRRGQSPRKVNRANNNQLNP
jgi:hypothetical protein